MISISLCMIVKNEERVLSRCLDSIADLCDEIIIVDTGSTDSTKEIAEKYTNKVYDFKWTGDFSEARNFAFSKATMEYIYSADADEVLDKENRQRFLDLKVAMLPEIEIVQMKYVEDDIQTVLNSKVEYRPKLYKRLRNFTWIDPVHETVRTLPVVFDSDIEILHKPEKLHASRDFELIEKAYTKEGVLSKNLIEMYVRELYKCADANQLKSAKKILEEIISTGTEDELFCKMLCVLAREARLSKNEALFIKSTSKLLASGGCAEVCCELGDYFYEKGDIEEATLWYYNALNESNSILDVEKENNYPKNMLLIIKDIDNL